MSKKMMKRSLALGALMAFVITGSAMAAETAPITESITGTGTLTITGANGGGSGNASPAVHATIEDITIAGFDKIELDGDWGNSNNAGKANDRNIFLAHGADITLNNLKELKYTDFEYQEHSGGIWGSIVFHGFNSGITINAETIQLENFCNGFFAQNDGFINVNASDIVLKSNDTQGSAIGVMTFNGNTSAGNPPITINTNNLTIETKKTAAISSTQGHYNETVGTATSGSINVIATGTVDITALTGVNASKGVSEKIKSSVNIKASDAYFTVGQKGINARDNANVNVIANQITIDATNNLDDAFGVYARNNADVTIDGNVNITATTTVEDASKDRWAVGVYSFTDNGLTDGNQINIGSSGKEVYIEANNAKGKAYGVMTYNDTSNLNTSPSKTVLTGGKVTINANTEDGRATGVMVGNDTVGSKKNLNTIVIDSPETIITASAKNDAGSSVGIQAISEGVVKINNGNVTITADRIISTRGTATTEINANNNDAYTVQLTGDIAFDYDGKTSGTPVDANVNINLANDKSFFTGKIGVTGDDIPDGYNKVNSMNIKVTNGAKWSLTGASIVNHAEFGKDSVLNIVTGSDFTGGVYALNASGAGTNSLKVEEGAKLQIGGMEETTYNLATGFGDYADVKGWNVIADNALMSVTLDKANGNLKATLSTSADSMEDSGAAPVGSGDMLQDLIKTGSNEETKAAYQFVKEVTSNGGDLSASNNALSHALQLAEAGGNSGTAVTVANNVSSVTTGRMGFSGGEKGGHGVGLLAEDSSAAIWAQYVHGKDRVEDMPMSGGATSYEGQFNGVVMGVDFKKVGKFQSGVAFNYGEGDTNSFGNAISTRSDYDFWGVGYYGNIRNEDTNFIFDVNYAKSDSDVEQVNGGTTLEASPETTTWSAGVKVEKLYQNNNVQIVPYTGLRFMSVDTDSYKATNGTDTLFNYAPERQDIWLLPLGVSIKQEVTNANGWVVTPKVDLSYIWAFGDTDSEMTVAIPGVSSTSRLGYTVMDDESWLGVVGLEAAKGDWTFGVSYSYQKGDHSENEKWYVDAKYSF